jgi:hypothetical protein
MRGLVMLALATIACGRYRFDPLAEGQSGDAAPDASAACAHTFCDDFDRPGPIEAGWDSTANSGAAMLVLAADASVSAPQSFLLSLPAPQLEGGFLVKQLPAATTSARIAFSVGYASTSLGTAEVDLVQLQWDVRPAACTSFGYYLVRDGTGPFDLQETYGGCGGNENTPLGDRGNSGFHAVVMVVTFGAIGTARVRVEIDGNLGVDKPTSHAIDPSSLTLRLGGGASRNMTAPWQIRYDDVIVDLQ